MEFAILIYVIAGLGAGILTGLAGISAATIISPMLIAFLDMDAYMAIAIALAADVLASAASAILYAKNKHIDIKRGFIMIASVLIFTFIGSYLATFMPNDTMGGISIVMSTMLGLNFLIFPVRDRKEGSYYKGKRFVFLSICCGVIVGFNCGFFGVGGGMVMLFVLTRILGYDIKTAVGTSVMIMTVTALVGATSRIALGGGIDLIATVVCVLATLVGAWGTSIFANKSNPKTLNRAIGVCLTILGGIMLLFKFVI